MLVTFCIVPILYFVCYDRFAEFRSDDWCNDAEIDAREKQARRCLNKEENPGATWTQELVSDWVIARRTPFIIPSLSSVSEL